MDRVDDAWWSLAGRVALGELPDEEDVLVALERADLLDERTVERAREALERFWEHVHEAPARALGLVTVARVAAAKAGGPPALGADLAHRQAMALYALGRARDSARTLEGALPLAVRPVKDASGAWADDASEAAGRRSGLLGFLANARLAQGDVPRALVALEEAMALARVHALRPQLGLLLSGLGNARLFVGEARAAADYYDDALRIARDLGNREGEAVNLNNIALARQALGDHEGALELLREALALARLLGDRRSAATIEANLAFALAEQGDLEQAALHQGLALELARAADDRSTQAVALVRLAAVARERGALAEAQARLDEADQLLAALEDPRRSSAWLEGARVALEVPDAEGARTLLTRALDVARAVGDRRAEAQVVRELGRAERLVGALEPSRAHLEDALAIARELEDPDLEAAAAASLAETRALESRGLEAGLATDAGLAAAVALLEGSSARAAARAGSPLEALHTLARAAVARASGELPRARALLEELVRASAERGHVAIEREAARRLAALR